MEEKVEKIYCCDRDNNDAALTAAILANGNNRQNDWGPIAAMMNGGMNNWMNNPFAYLMFLALFRNRGFDDGNGTATQGIETQAQLNAIRSQLQDNQNADCIKSAIQGNGFAISQLAQILNIDFNTLQKCCCDVQAAIQQVAGQIGFSAERVINAVNMGDCNVIQAIKDCCCTTQKSILEMGYQNQLANCNQTNTLLSAINNVNTGVERGFSSVAYETQKQTCDIINAGNANTQRIIDTLNNHWAQELSQKNQDLKFEISQLKQNQYLASIINGGCGCGNNCGQ